MEYETEQLKPKLFKSAALRKAFMNEVMVAFEAAQGHAELICLYQGFEPTFLKMAEGEEYDVMMLECINVRYRGLHERHEQEHERIKRALEAYEESGF